MAIEKVYHVVTEFQFEVQAAVAKSEVIQGALGKISGAADTALFSVTNLSKYLMSGFGANLTAFGLFAKSLKASESAFKAQTMFANLLGGNIEYLQGDVQTFNDRLLVSKQIMGEIAAQARKFGLSQQTLFNSTKMSAALLIPKGLAGDNMGNAINMARMFEKSAPILGIDTFEAQGQMMRLIEGQASMGDTLFRRLVGETAAFKDMRGGNAAKQFNLLPAEQRFNRFMKALAQFSSDADVNARMADLLAQKWQVLNDVMWGFNGIFLPLGNTLKKFIGSTMDEVIKRVETQGPKFVKLVDTIMQQVLRSPEDTYANLKQLSALQKDVARAGKVSGMIGLFTFITWIGRQATALTGVNLTLGALFKTLLRFTGIASAGGGILVLANAMRIFRVGLFLTRFAIMRVFAPLAILTTLFQIISRAKAKADVANVKFLANNIGGISDNLTRMYNASRKIMAPWSILVDMMADAIAPLFELDTYMALATTGLEWGADAAELLGKASLWLAGVFSSMPGTIAQFANDYVKVTSGLWMAIFNTTKLVFSEMATMISATFRALMTGNLAGVPQAGAAAWNNIGAGLSGAASPLTSALGSLSGQAYSDIYTKAIADMNQRYVAAINGGEGDKNVSNRTTNIGKIEIRNDFKENMEPDRIAHSLMKTIMDAAKNPTQAANRSQQAAFVGGR